VATKLCAYCGHDWHPGPCHLDCLDCLRRVESAGGCTCPDEAHLPGTPPRSSDHPRVATGYHDVYPREEDPLRYLVALLLLLFLAGCPGRTGGGDYGRTFTVTLRPGEKLVGASWRESDLWVPTRKAKTGEAPEVHVFRELSRSGWFEASVTIGER
jgi:hypothetical protein